MMVLLAGNWHEVLALHIANTEGERLYHVLYLYTPGETRSVMMDHAAFLTNVRLEGA